MWIRVLRAEVLKLRRSGFLLPVVLVPLLAAAAGLLFGGHLAGGGAPGAWLVIFRAAAGPYAGLFLPLAVGLEAALACQVDHAAGGFRLMAAQPAPRLALYAVKFAAILAAVAAMQALFVAGIWADGRMIHVTALVPWGLLVPAVVHGWLAAVPLAALMLWVGTVWPSFGAQFAAGAMLTIPSLLILNSLRFAAWYPWSQPALAMLGVGAGHPLALVVAGYATLFGLAGATHFVRRDVAS